MRHVEPKNAPTANVCVATVAGQWCWRWKAMGSGGTRPVSSYAFWQGLLTAMHALASHPPFASSFMLQDRPPHTVLDEEMPQFSTLLEHCPVTCPRHLASLFGLAGGPGLYFHSLSQSRNITAHGQQNLWVRHRNPSGPSVLLHLCPHPDEFLRVWRWGFQTGFA